MTHVGEDVEDGPWREHQGGEASGEGAQALGAADLGDEELGEGALVEGDLEQESGDEQKHARLVVAHVEPRDGRVEQVRYDAVMAALGMMIAGRQAAAWAATGRDGRASGHRHVVVVEGDQSEDGDEEHEDAARSRRIGLREEDGLERAEDHRLGLLAEQRGAQRTALRQAEEPQELDERARRGVLDEAQVLRPLQALDRLVAVAVAGRGRARMGRYDSAATAAAAVIGGGRRRRRRRGRGERPLEQDEEDRGDEEREEVQLHDVYVLEQIVAQVDAERLEALGDEQREEQVHDVVERERVLARLVQIVVHHSRLLSLSLSLSLTLSLVALRLSLAFCVISLERCEMMMLNKLKRLVWCCCCCCSVVPFSPVSE